MLKRLGSVLTLSFFLAPAVAGAAANTVTRVIEVSPADVVVRQIGGHDFVELRGGAHAMPLGAPDLPLLPVHMEIPAGFDIASVRVVPLATEMLPGQIDPGAVGTARAGEWTRPGDLDAAIRGSDSWYPSEPVMQYRTGRLRGRNLAAIAVAPVTWLPATGGLKLMTRFRVEVSLNPAAPDPGALVIRRESPEGRRSFDETLQLLTGVRASGVAGAASELHPLVNSGGPFEPTFRPSVDGSPVEMVIITTTDQAPVYQDLADYKTKIGLSTVVRTVDWIKANYPNGVDTQETIRNFIRDAVSKWGTTWVLLGGDTDHIPVRYGYTTFYTSQGEDIPTDLYYTDLDGNWNGDGDAVFGEAYSTSAPPGDGLDLYPDVWVGRITSQDSTSARNMVDKTLGYLRNPPIGHQNDILLAGEVLFPPNWEPGYSIQYDGAVLCEDVVDSLNVQSNPIRLYENYTAWPGASAENKASVVGALNGGIGVFHHVGHGYINTMSVGLGAQILINSDIDALSNGNETFVVYAINCTSAAIDFNCIAERFLSNTHGGGVAVVGSTRLDFPSTGVYFQNEFYGLIYRRGVTEMGKAVAMAKIPEIPYSTQDNTYRWTQFTQIYLGDPNLQVWTDTPSTLTVTHASTFTLGQGTYSVTVMRGGSPVDSARVALYKDGDAYSVGLTDPSGQVVLPFRPDQTGAFSVGVHSHNDLPYLGSATVVAPGGAPYLFALSQAFVDDGSGSTDGNGDGRLDSGETVELNIALKNNGGAGETGITATLTSGDPELNVIDNFAQYPDIGTGASSSANDPFVLSVPRSALDRLEAHCTLNIFGNSGAYSQEIIVYGHAPELDYQQQSVRDTVGNGNGNGVIAANEDFAIIPTVHNSGLGTTRGLEARLRSSDPAVTITDSVSVLGALITGQSGVNPADGLAARLSDVSTAHELTLVLVDAYGELSTIPLDITPPDTVMNVVSYGQATSIALTWTQSTSADLRGYNVYRATSSSGPFTRINPTSFERTSYYNDEGLPSLTRYYYEVAPVDSSGNEGRKSVATSATTSLPIHDGFPVEVTSATTAGITLADLNHDGQPEILGGGEEIYAVQSNGDEYYDGDQDVRTLGPITKTGGMLFWNTPAVGDVDRDGEPEVAGVSWSDVNVRLLDRFGIAMPGWPKDGNPLNEMEPNPLGSVCLADVDADGTLEVLCSVGRVLFCWHYDGTELRDGDNNPATDGILAVTGEAFSYSTPTVANIDGDPYPEIIAGMHDGKLYVFHHDGTPYAGFPFATGGNITSSPAVADINLDGQPEIVFGSSDSKLYAIHSDLTSAPGFPVGIQLAQDVDSSPAIGDITGDGIPDVAIGASNGALFVFRGQNGTIPAGFPIQIRDNLGVKVAVRSSPVLADVDGDGQIDIVFGDQKGRLHCVDRNGQYLPGFPIQTGNLIENAPAVWDVDGDGLTEILAESFDQKIYCWDTPWTFNPALAAWPMFKHDQRNSGIATTDVFELTGVGDGNQLPESRGDSFRTPPIRSPPPPPCATGSPRERTTAGCGFASST